MLMLPRVKLPSTKSDVALFGKGLGLAVLHCIGYTLRKTGEFV
jgi:hypothetical protein